MSGRRWFRRRSHLPTAPREGAAEMRVAALHAHAAEGMVVLSLTPADVPILHGAVARAAAGRPVTLSAGRGRPVTFVPGTAGSDPALDPDSGWLVPVTTALAEEVRHAIRAEPGGWEMSTLNLGILITTDPR